MSRRCWRLSALLCVWLCCTYSAAAQPVTTAELVSELQTISTLLETARSEYATVSSRLEKLENEEIPHWVRQHNDLRTSFADYRQTVTREIDRLTMGVYVAGGVAAIATVTTMILLIRGGLR